MELLARKLKDRGFHHILNDPLFHKKDLKFLTFISDVSDDLRDLIVCSKTYRDIVVNYYTDGEGVDLDDVELPFISLSIIHNFEKSGLLEFEEGRELMCEFGEDMEESALEALVDSPLVYCETLSEELLKENKKERKRYEEIRTLQKRLVDHVIFALRSRNQIGHLAYFLWDKG